MNVFTSDDELRRLQRSTLKGAIGVASAEAQRREFFDNEAELREHARWRSIAYLGFALPVTIAILSTAAQWLAARLLATAP